MTKASRTRSVLFLYPADLLYKLRVMDRKIRIKDAALAEALNSGYRAILEGKGMVCRIIDGTRDGLVQARGMSKELANQVVLATRHLFLDPLAAPGVSPTTDPTFKKMLPLFPQLAFMMVDRYRMGSPTYRREAAEEFSTKFVEYCKQHYPNGAPEMGDDAFDNLATEVSGSDIEQDIGSLNYEAIRVNSWDELRRLSERFHLDRWCNVQHEDDWDRYSLYGDGRFYLLVRRGADQSKSYDKYSVIGVTLNAYGDVVYAFDRANDVVSKNIVRQIVENAGLNTSEASSFGNAIDVMKHERLDPESVFPDCERLNKSEYCIVGFSGNGQRGYCILHDDNIPSYTTDVYDSIEAFNDNEAGDFVVANGHLLVDYTDGNVVLDTKNMNISTDGQIYLDENHSMLRVYKPGSHRIANGIFLYEAGMPLFLSKDTECELTEAKFCSCVNKKPALVGMKDTDFWAAAVGDDIYIVRKAGARLDECIKITNPGVELYVDDILTPDGYYRIARFSQERKDRVYYLYKDGKPALDQPFNYIDINNESGSFLIELEDFENNMYLFDPNTKQMSKMD